MAEGRWKQAIVCAMIALGIDVATAAGPVEYPGPAPGKAQASVKNDEITLSNNVLECRWSIADGRLRPMHIRNQGFSTVSLQDSECFQLLLADGRTLKASDLEIVRGPAFDARREVTGVESIRVSLATPDNRLAISWRAELGDGSNYVRQHVSITATQPNMDVREIVLVQLRNQNVEAAGTVDGSPLTVAGRYFLAFENPLSKIHTLSSQIRCSLPRSMPLKVADTETYSSVMGVAPERQLRRAFLYYVERERAQPYRPFLHYNSWYDIGYGGENILEPDALKVIELFGDELSKRRGVKLDSFVWDDGWDNPASLWRFHEGFPEGFARLHRAAVRSDSAIGAWLSPWGGYGQPKEERMKYGKQEGFETNDRGFSMAGPRYYERFRDACLGMIRDYNLNYFKFDGISDGGTPTGAAAAFAADVEALLRLAGDLRKAQPNVFINVTTGTWSSPYWLWYADSTWRSGADWSTCGWGSKRQQQVTYRDAQTYQNVVCRAPLYPINSLMTQGVMFANHGLPDDTDRIAEDIRAFFASGTNCQELYITPSRLDARAWDVLAEAAQWSRNNADVLVDTHWIGGDPAKGEVYGWASWSKRKGILALRNPKDTPGQIVVDVDRAFELPQGAAKSYSLKSPWKDDGTSPKLMLSAGEPHVFELKPFEVVVFDATPQ